MENSAGDLQIVLADASSTQLREFLGSKTLTCHSAWATLPEVLKQKSCSLLIVPAAQENATLLVESIRQDKAFENLPIVFYSDKAFGLLEKNLAALAGVNDFIYLKDPERELVCNRVLAMASLYSQLARARAASNSDELVRSVEFLDSLIEHLPNMVFVKDAKELRFVRFNRAGEKLLGYDRTELIGKNDYDIFPKEEADHFTSKDRAVISSGQLLDIAEEPIHTKDGLRVLHTRKIPLYDESGAPTYLLGISEDITEIKKAEQERAQLALEQSAREEAERAVAVRDEFLALSSHELKTPLTSLNLQFQIIKRVINKKEFSDAGVQKLLRILESSFYQLSRLSKLIDDLLDVSRIQSGKLSFYFEKCDLAPLLKESVMRMEDQFKEANCPIVWGPVETAICLCDTSRIEQCFTNLFTNAIKYGAKHPVEISLKCENKKAVLRVTDSGIGVDPSSHERIFRRFERAVSPRSISGLGLGLFISKEIMEAHGGQITVKSELAKGSTFALEIPMT